MLIRPTLELVDPMRNKAHRLCYREKRLERERQAGSYSARCRKG